MYNYVVYVILSSSYTDRELQKRHNKINAVVYNFIEIAEQEEAIKKARSKFNSN